MQSRSHEEQAAGHKPEAVPAQSVVAAARDDNLAPRGTIGEGTFVDFAHLKRQLPLARVLDHRFARFQASDSRPRRIAKIAAKTVIYAIPAVTGWQRLRSDQHYLWSVVLGAGLSAFVTDATLRSHDRAATAPP